MILSFARVGVGSVIFKLYRMFVIYLDCLCGTYVVIDCIDGFCDIFKINSRSC